MLYDPKWDNPSFTLPKLIAWLEQYPADREYNFADCRGGCLLGQFIKANGWTFSAERYGQASQLGSHDDLGGQIAAVWPHTFGAALERARAKL